MSRFSEMSGTLEVMSLNQLPVLQEGDDLARIIVERAEKSNVKGDSTYALLPQDPDASARRLRKRIRQLTGRQVGVVICDTRSRPFRKGQVEESIGVAGLNPLIDYRGQKDLFGYTLRFKNVAIADELASAAELVMGQGRERTPVAIIRGLTRIRFQDRASSKTLEVSSEEDLFK